MTAPARFRAFGIPRALARGPRGGRRTSCCRSSDELVASWVSCSSPAYFPRGTGSSDVGTFCARLTRGSSCRLGLGRSPWGRCLVFAMLRVPAPIPHSSAIVARRHRVRIPASRATPTCPDRDSASSQGVLVNQLPRTTALTSVLRILAELERAGPLVFLKFDRRSVGTSADWRGGVLVHCSSTGSRDRQVERLGRIPRPRSAALLPEGIWRRRRRADSTPMGPGLSIAARD